MATSPCIPPALLNAVPIRSASPISPKHNLLLHWEVDSVITRHTLCVVWHGRQIVAGPFPQAASKLYRLHNVVVGLPPTQNNISLIINSKFKHTPNFHFPTSSDALVIISASHPLLLPPGHVLERSVPELTPLASPLR